MPKNKEIKKQLQSELNIELMMATAAGFSGRVRRLTKKGANVNFISENGETPLYVAACKRDTKIVGWLLKRGAKNNVSKDITPLHIAAIFGYADVAQLLIQEDSEINLNKDVKNQGVLGPLSLAIVHKKLNVVKLLVESGAEVLSNHIPRHTPSEATREIIQLLIPYLLLSNPRTAKMECINQYPELANTWDDSLAQIKKMQKTLISKVYNYYDLLTLESTKLVTGVTTKNLIPLKKLNFDENFPSYAHQFQKKREQLVALKEQQQAETLSKENIIFFKKRPSNSAFTRSNASTSGHSASLHQ